MQALVKIFMSVMTILLVAACGEKSSDDFSTRYDKSMRDYELANKKRRAEMDQELERLKNGTAESSKKLIEAMLDATAAGGPPGSLSVNRSLYEMLQRPDTNIRVTRTTGRSWRGIAPALSSPEIRILEQPSIKMKVPPSRTYINFGCDLSNRTELKGFSEKTVSIDVKKVTTLEAQFVFLCGKPDLGKTGLSISARTLVLVDFEFEFVGNAPLFHLEDYDGMDEVNISVKALQLTGENRLVTRGLSSSFMEVAPSISVLVATTTGTGRLELASFGFDHKSMAVAEKSP